MMSVKGHINVRHHHVQNYIPQKPLKTATHSYHIIEPRAHTMKNVNSSGPWFTLKNVLKQNFSTVSYQRC